MPSTFAAQADTDPQATAAAPEGVASNQDQSSDQNVALIVGERAFTTMEDVKTKIVNADQHINDIEAENATLRTQLDEANVKLETSTSLDEVLKSKEDNKDVGLTPDQIKELVGGEVTNISKANTRDANRAQCLGKAEESYGKDFIVKMQEVATSVGMNMEEVDKMAESNPKLFARTFLPNEPSKEAPAHSHTSTIRTSNFQDTPRDSDIKPVLSLTSKERTAQLLRQLEPLSNN